MLGGAATLAIARCSPVCPTAAVCTQILLERDPAGQAQPPEASAQQPDGRSWAAVAALLSRKHERLDPTKALHLLPGQVPQPSH